MAGDVLAGARSEPPDRRIHPRAARTHGVRPLGQHLQVLLEVPRAGCEGPAETLRPGRPVAAGAADVRAPAEAGLKAVILVGGEGTRMRPLTETTPKPLLPFMNRPFLAQVLDHLA